MRTERTVFQEVKRRATKRGICSRCGKMHTRTKVFVHTINPFNLNAEGAPKSFTEVLASVTEVAEKWRAMPIEPCTPRGRTEP